MARNKLPLSHYEARMVVMPGDAGQAVEAVRMTVFGPCFQQRAIEPELLAGDQIAHHTSIARDQRSIQGYFWELPPDGAAIRVRYGDSLEGVLEERFARSKVRQLDRDCGSGG